MNNNPFISIDATPPQPVMPTNTATSDTTAAIEPPTTEPSATASAPAQASQANLPSQPVKSKKTHLPLIISLIVLGVIAAFGGIGYYYTRTPQYAVSHAIDSLLASRGDSISLTATASDSSNSTSSGTLDFIRSGSNITLSGAAKYTYNDGSTNLGTSQLSLVRNDKVNYVRAGLSSQIATTYSTAKDLSGQWFKVSDSELKDGLKSSYIQLSVPLDAFDCIDSSASELDNASTRQELVDALMNSGLLKLDQLKHDHSGDYYGVTLDADHYGDYAKAVAKTKVVSKLNACIANLSNNDSDSDDDDSFSLIDTSDSAIKQEKETLNETKPQLRLYISGHINKRLTGATITYTDKVTGTLLTSALTAGYSSNSDADESATINVKFAGKTPHINIPTTTKSYDELKSALQTVLGGLSVGPTTASEEAASITNCDFGANTNGDCLKYVK